MDEAARGLARKVKEEAKENAGEIKEAPDPVIQTIMLTLSAGFAGVTLAILLLMLAHHISRD